MKPARQASARKIGWPKILNAIYTEGNDWAAYFASIRGREHWFEIATGKCQWLRYGKSGMCGGFIVEYMPDECSFAGKPGYSRSYESVDVVARKIPGQRAAQATLHQTYDYYYCYS